MASQQSAKEPHGRWQPHTVHQYNPLLHAGTRKIPALHQFVTGHLDCTSTVPYLAYMPEQRRLAMLINCGVAPHRPHLIFSDDDGATWTDPKPVNEVSSGLGVGLTYLGKGRLMFTVNRPPRRFFSDDFGETWPRSAPKPPSTTGMVMEEWDPPLVDRDPKTGDIRRLISTAHQGMANSFPNFNPHWGCMRTSTDLGQTWSDDVFVPQWRGAHEMIMIRAANGNLVVAGKTTYLEEQLWYMNSVPEEHHYQGLSYSYSKDDGKTWADERILYRYGRHHCSMVVLPNGDIVMAYVVRKGYPRHPWGFEQFGIEAIVSHDHGQTWDMDRPFILNKWSANRKDEKGWWASSQGTSSVLLPGGDILTCYSSGHRSGLESPHPRDVGLLRWKTDA